MGSAPVKTKQAAALALGLVLAVGTQARAPAAHADGPPSRPAATAPAGQLDRPSLPADAAPAAGDPASAPAGAPAGPEQTEQTEQEDHDGHSDHDGHGKLFSAAGLGGLYTALSVWAYFAWYYGVPELPAFRVSGDGWFGATTYAGGADKLGHLWANYVITRASTRLLRRGGWSRLQASLIAGGMAVVFFTFVEVKDGYYYQFSLGDAVGNSAGVALSFLLENLPAVDDLLDFRLEYRPSAEYVNHLFNGGDVNIAEDYSGQSYLVALHLGAVPRLTDSRWTGWARYVDVVAGFETRNYKPTPSDPDARRSQSLFVGASINLQSVLQRAFGEPPRRTGHRIGHAAFEVYSPPYTTWRAITSSRSPDPIPGAAARPSP